MRWETKVSPDALQYFFHGDPFVAGDVIVAAADRATGANIHAFSRSTGKELWQYPAGRGVNGPLAGAGIRIYAGTLDGQLLSLEATSGAIRWRLSLQVPGFEGPALAGTRLVAGTVEGSLYGINVETGEEQWRRELGSRITTTPSVSPRDVYAGTIDGTLHQVDVDNGRVLASRKLDSSLKPTSVPVRAAGSIVVLLTDHAADYRALMSLDLRLDRVRWRTEAPSSWSTTRIFVWGDVLVLGTPSGDVLAYCTETGALSWTRSVKGPVRAIGGAADTLLVGTRTGGLSAIRAPQSCTTK